MKTAVANLEAHSQTSLSKMVLSCAKGIKSRSSLTSGGEVSSLDHLVGAHENLKVLFVMAYPSVPTTAVSMRNKLRKQKAWNLLDHLVGAGE
jgi:hypothetical protein